MKTTVLFQGLPEVYAKLLSNWSVMKTEEGRQKSDFFKLCVPQGKKRTPKKSISVIAFLCGENL